MSNVQSLKLNEEYESSPLCGGLMHRLQPIYTVDVDFGL